MENGFYPARMKSHGIDVLVPDSESRTRINEIIFEELRPGKVLNQSGDQLIAVIKQAKANGADSVIFGCTEICMILDTDTDTDTDTLPLAGFDSTAIHVEAAAEFALADH